MAKREHRSMSAEDRLIAQYFRPLARAPGALALNDDAAFYAPPKGCDLVLTKDAIVAGVHFLPNDPPETIGRKALRVNLSDLAAKGAEPAGFLLALGLPERQPKWLEAFARGLGADADAFGCPLLGGDTVKTSGSLFISITAFGTLPSGTMVHRNGAKVGDAVMVTGTVGDAALGLRLEQAKVGKKWKPGREEREHLIGRYHIPQPRNGLAAALRQHATAAMDVSDGLVGDLAKLCRTSDVSAAVEVTRIPLSFAASAALRADTNLLPILLTGGDDYELLFTLPPKRVAALHKLARDADIVVTEIGRVRAGHAAPCFLDSNGQPLAFAQPSFSHF